MILPHPHTVQIPPSIHLVSTLLQGDHVCRATEIFSVGMKLRQVFSLIGLHPYQRKDPCDLLKDERTDALSRNLRQLHMIAAT